MFGTNLHTDGLTDINVPVEVVVSGYCCHGNCKVGNREYKLSSGSVNSPN